MCTLPLLAGENIGSPVRGADGGGGGRPRGAHSADRPRRPASRPRDRRRARAGSRATSWRSADIFTSAATGWCAPTAIRRTPSASSAPAIDLARAARPAGRGGLSGRLRRAAARARARPHLVVVQGPAGARPAAGPADAERTRRRRLLEQAGIESVSPDSSSAPASASACSSSSCCCSSSRVLGDRRCASGRWRRWRRSRWSGCARRQRRAELRELWPDVVDNLASAVRAGLVPAGGAGADRPSAGPEELRRAVPAFRRRLPRHRPVLRLPRPAQGAAWPTRSGDRIIESLRIAREVGGSDLGPAAAHVVAVPARGRADPVRAGGPAVLDGERRPAGASPRRGSCCCSCRSTATSCRRTTARAAWWSSSSAARSASSPTG